MLNIKCRQHSLQWIHKWIKNVYKSMICGWKVLFTLFVTEILLQTNLKVILVSQPGVIVPLKANLWNLEFYSEYLEKSKPTPFWLSFCFTLTWVTIPSWNGKTVEFSQPKSADWLSCYLLLNFSWNYNHNIRMHNQSASTWLAPNPFPFSQPIFSISLWPNLFSSFAHKFPAR